MTAAAGDEVAGVRIPADIIIDLQKRFGGFAVPVGPIDPSTETDEALQNYGLPPKPDDGADLLLLQAWRRAFGQLMTLEPYNFEDDLVQGTLYRPRRRRIAQMLVAATRVETSANWSGAYITANRDQQFLQVWGFWTIPSNLRLPRSPHKGNPDVPYICSNWIGLDGQRRYLDSSLPQIGTASTLVGNNASVAQAWVQWWARGDADAVPLPLRFTVNPGDDIACVLTAWDPQTVRFTIVNLSASPLPTAMTVWGSSPPVTLSDKSIIHPNIAGATAEWVVERPAIVHETTDYNFPDYDETEFSFCLAVEGASVNIASLSAGMPQMLRGERLIRMFDMLMDPARSAFISMPQKLSDTSICVKYGGF